jgi:hypothetical protein
MNSFAHDAGTYKRPVDLSDIEINFGDLSAYGSSVIGLCQTSSNRNDIVTINQSWWNRVSETQRNLLVHHELGHCELYRPHRTTLGSDGNPISIMYPVILSSSVYQAKAGDYLSELYLYGWSTEVAASDKKSKKDQNPHIHICTPEDLGL